MAHKTDFQFQKEMRDVIRILRNALDEMKSEQKWTKLEDYILDLESQLKKMQ